MGLNKHRFTLSSLIWPDPQLHSLLETCMHAKNTYTVRFSVVLGVALECPSQLPYVCEVVLSPWAGRCMTQKYIQVRHAPYVLKTL